MANEAHKWGKRKPEVPEELQVRGFQRGYENGGGEGGGTCFTQKEVLFYLWNLFFSPVSEYRIATSKHKSFA